MGSFGDHVCTLRFPNKEMLGLTLLEHFFRSIVLFPVPAAFIRMRLFGALQ